MNILKRNEKKQQKNAMQNYSNIIIYFKKEKKAFLLEKIQNKKIFVYFLYKIKKIIEISVFFCFTFNFGGDTGVEPGSLIDQGNCKKNRFR